jgi:hypothetical protein
MVAGSCLFSEQWLFRRPLVVLDGVFWDESDHAVFVFVTVVQEFWQQKKVRHDREKETY